MILRNPSGIWKTNAKKVYYRGVVYDSMKSASYYLGLTETTIKSRLKEGVFKGFPIACSKTFSVEKLNELKEKDAIIFKSGMI